MTDVRKTKTSTFLIKLPLLAAAVAVSAASAMNAQAAIDIFLKITGPDIVGESLDDRHKNEIEVQSVQSGFALAKDANVLKLGKPTCGPVEITKLLDKASVPLTDALMKQTVLAKAVFTFRKPGKDLQEFYIVTLTNAYVTSLTQMVDGTTIGETVDLLARSMEVTYKAQKPDGSLDAGITTVVDCTGGKVA